MTRRPVVLPLLLALVLGALGWAGLTPTAYAGGPTSVLLVNPGRPQVTAAYYTDSRYAALAAAVGEGQTGPSAPPPGDTEGGDEVRLAWLIHDVQIWRVDRVHLTGDGVWVETVVDINDRGDVFDRPAVWHRPADEAALTGILTEAGVLGDESPASPPPARAEAAGADPATPAPGLVAAALSGLVVGAAGALVGVRARRRAAQPPRVTLTG